jgi:hypothetical protein
MTVIAPNRIAQRAQFNFCVMAMACGIVLIVDFIQPIDTDKWYTLRLSAL